MKSNMSSFSSSYGRLELHVCFKVKYCHKIFAAEKIKNRCREIFSAAAERHGIVINEMGFDGDHVHLVVQLNPSMSVSGMAKILKGTSEKSCWRSFRT